ncbi:MAG: hypothetical protein OEM25_04325 [Gammaproteobacteria bacterium]|nr:hypothetical protein [Gammaproteobacteria bacterium]
MRHLLFKNSFPASNPIANILVMIAAALIIVTSIVLGIFAFIALSAIVLLTAAVVGVRVWWLNRKIAGAGQAPSPDGIIEGEYRVVSKDHDEA